MFGVCVVCAWRVAPHRHNNKVGAAEGRKEGPPSKRALPPFGGPPKGVPSKRGPSLLREGKGGPLVSHRGSHLHALSLEAVEPLEAPWTRPTSAHALPVPSPNQALRAVAHRAGRVPAPLLASAHSHLLPIPHALCPPRRLFAPPFSSPDQALLAVAGRAGLKAYLRARCFKPRAWLQPGWAETSPPAGCAEDGGVGEGEREAGGVAGGEGESALPPPAAVANATEGGARGEGAPAAAPRRESKAYADSLEVRGAFTGGG